MKEKEKKKLSLNVEFLYKAGAVFLGVMAAITLTRNILIISKAHANTDKLKQEIEKIKIDNEQLKQKIEMSASEEFIERQAREKLGLVKEGETVIVLPEEEALRQLSPKFIEEEHNLPDPNWKKWLKLFL